MIAHIAPSGQENKARRGGLRGALLVTTALVGSMLALPAQAQQTWVGGTSTDWFDAANWDTGVPTAADNANIAESGAANMPVIDGAAAVVDRVFLGFATGAPSSTLTIQNAGILNSSFGYIGFAAGSSGMVTVDGSGSTWTSANAIFVGDFGTGSLLISNGGAVSNADGYIGLSPGSMGSVSVTGAGSLWDNSGNLRVGDFGTGSLTISNGGAVSNVDGVIGNTATGNGTVTVTGPGSTWFTTSEIYVGHEGDGSLTISNGGTVNNNSAIIGNMATGSGTVTVTGPGSSWNNTNDLRVSEVGSGSLSIENGGTVSNRFGFIGFTAGSIGTVTVTGPGSSWNNTNDLRVGEVGSGSLSIENGGTVSNASGAIGDIAGSTGTVAVTGPGSSWNNTNDLSVGNFGTGSLTISNGGTVNNTLGSIADEPTGTGSVTVTGPGSTWTNTSELYVGREGDGSLTISNGGAVSNTAGFIGLNSGSTGNVSVTGPGSLWDNSGSLLIGEGGSGSLNILDGGTVNNAFGIIGDSAGSTGRVTVDGPGSNWNNANDVFVGNSGTGYLIISNGGSVDVAFATGSVFVAQNAGSQGGVIIGGDAAPGAGTLHADAIIFGDGNGLLVFNHTDSAYTFVPDITGSGTILHVTGTTNYTGDGSGFTGTTDIIGGTLYVNNLLGGAVNVTVGGAVNAIGGTLGGEGTLTGALTIGADGTIAPGNSIGTLIVADITIDAGSTYEVEVNSAGQSDLINATGTATINGGAVQVVPFPDFVLGTDYTIVTAAGGVTGTFDSASFNSLFITPTLTYNATDVILSLAQTADFADVAMTPNQIAAAGGAQSLGGGALYTAILSLGDAGEAQAAFDAISGEIHASAKAALIEDSRFAREAAMERLRIALGGLATDREAQAEMRIDDAAAFWGQAFGSWGSWDSDGNAAELDRSIGGLFLGGDALVMDNVRLGLFGGYSNSSLDVDDRNSSGSAESWHLGAYGGTELGNLGLRFGGAYSWHDVNTARSVAFTGFSDSLSSSYSARTGQVFGEAGYIFDMGTVSFEPFANLAYVHLSADGYTETGGAAALSGGGSSMGTTFTTIGVRAETEVGLGESTARLSGSAGWRHAFGDVTPTATHAFAGGSPFTVAGVPIARDAFVLDLEASINLTPDATLGLTYGGQFGSGFADQSLKANLAVQF